MSTHSQPAVRAYLARVRTALSDLPDAEIDEIVDDVRPHLAEIAEGLGERASVAAMTEELGTPESYAAEVRAAGEYPPAPPAKGAGRAVESGRAVARMALYGMLLGAVIAAFAGGGAAASLDSEPLLLLLLAAPTVAMSVAYLVTRGTAAIAALPEVRAVTAAGRGDKMAPAVRWLRTAGPVWWVLAAIGLVYLGIVLVVKNGSAVALLGLLVLAGLLLWAGPKSGRDRALVAVTLPLSAFVLGAGLGLAGSLIETTRFSELRAEQVPTYYPQGPNGEPLLRYGDQDIDNLYVFDSEGAPLTDVFLYTEDGRPLVVPRHGCDPTTQERIRTGEDNRFPRPHIEQGGYDDYGVPNGYNAHQPFCREVTEVPFTAAIPVPR
ncbi:hypothetical protein B1813_19785 [Saccharomonospora piscinae]|uniref:Uncharacterized protein n=1 Tax=Saccharomonospora piscinae TaxID=687388 RepID=A0A1V8ZZ87_SACPI|nr:hypothetical protein [Saccharomonospora piscinae]OQO90063.1 hypothetical protein B1813_19785 [Saccharomonospora piscinae]